MDIFHPPQPDKTCPRVTWGQTYGCSKSLALAKAIERFAGMTLVITPDIQSAVTLKSELTFFLRGLCRDFPVSGLRDPPLRCPAPPRGHHFGPAAHPAFTAGCALSRPDCSGRHFHEPACTRIVHPGPHTESCDWRSAGTRKNSGTPWFMQATSTYPRSCCTGSLPFAAPSSTCTHGLPATLPDRPVQ